MGELLVRWALVIGFGLLAGVTGLAAIMHVSTGQPGNVPMLLITAIVSALASFIIWRSIKRRA